MAYLRNLPPPQVVTPRVLGCVVVACCNKQEKENEDGVKWY